MRIGVYFHIVFVVSFEAAFGALVILFIARRVGCLHVQQQILFLHVPFLTELARVRLETAVRVEMLRQLLSPRARVAAFCAFAFTFRSSVSLPEMFIEGFSRCKMDLTAFANDRFILSLGKVGLCFESHARSGRNEKIASNSCR